MIRVNLRQHICRLIFLAGMVALALLFYTESANAEEVAPVTLLPEGLIAYYPFNCNAKDESGNGYSAMVTGAKLTADRFNRAELAYAFDGIDDEIVIDPPPPLDAKSFSVAVWVRFDFPDEYIPWVDIGDGGVKCRDPIIGQDDGYAIRCFQLWVSDKALLWHRMNEYSSVWTKWPLVKDKWYHIVVTFDGKQHTLYVDGKEEWGAPGIFKVNASEPIRIGSKGDKLVKKRAFFSGAIDDIRFYNRTLTAAEVLSLYEEIP